MTVEGNRRHRTHIGRVHEKWRLQYLSEAPFADGSQYLKVVKVYCEENEKKGEGDSVSKSCD